jgi:hypothetical protein
VAPTIHEKIQMTYKKQQAVVIRTSILGNDETQDIIGGGSPVDWKGT